MSDIVIQEENTSEVVMEVYDLASDHYYEVESKSSVVGFNLDIGVVQHLIESGLLFVVTARDEGGLLVGYFANLVSPDLMTSRMTSRELAIYVRPEYRGMSIFPRMTQAVEEGAKKRGAYSQMLAFKEGHDAGYAQKLGYAPTETLYQKLLEG